MSTLHYTPGAWRAVVVPQGVAVLPEGTDAALLDRIWTALRAGEGLGAVLEALTGTFGTSLSSLPPFAVATVSGSAVRLAVRGELTIDVVEGSAAENAAALSVSGADVTTWSERVVAEARHITVRTPQSTAAGAPGQRFGVASGVVLVSSVELDVAGDADGETAAFVPVGAASPAPAEPTSAPAPASASAPAEPSPAPSAPAPAEPSPAPSAPASDEVPEATLMTDEVVAETAVTDEGAQSPPVIDADAADAHDSDASGADASGADASGADEPQAQGDAVVDDVDELEHTRDELPDDAYDHLWGATVVKSVEDAAVRELDDDDEAEAVAATPVASASEPGSAAAEAAAPAAAPMAPPAAPPVAPAPPPAVPSSGLIDGVPDFGGLGAASGSASINGSTVPPAAPAPAGPPAGAAPAAGQAPADDDHDGLTVTVSELDAMRRLGAAGGDAPAALPDSALGRIVLSTGETHPLDRPVIIGRRPRANRVQVDRVPVLVTVPSPEQDISRNHLEIRLEGRHVLVVDLDTTNGSVLHREGTPPLRLGPNEPVLVLSRDIVDLGDGVTVTFEEIP